MDNFNIAGIIYDSIVDGPGVRVAIFCQGCPHACEGCHNPDSHSFNTKRIISVLQVYSEIKKNKLCKGVTFSGGEPFCQALAFCKLAKMLKADGYEIACYTGYTYEELLLANEEQKNLLCMLDVLIDGKFILQKRNLSLNFRGSENQRIIDVQNSLLHKKTVLLNDKRWQGDDYNANEV